MNEKICQAYEWAMGEMNRLFPHPDYKKIVGIGGEDDFDTIGTHLSIFVKPGSEQGILCVYWVPDKLVKFSVLENAGEILREHQEVANRWINNGLQFWKYCTLPDK